MSGCHSLHAIFSSLQGEGRNTGRPCTFIRFCSCNLSCKWCDTHKDEKLRLTTREVLEKVEELENRSIVVTGGEPTIQPGLDELLLALRAQKYWIALETNGLVAPRHPEFFDYISVSPKADFHARYNDAHMLRKADEVRIVATSDEIAPFCHQMRQRIEATDYYISPLTKDDRIHYHRAIKLLKKVNQMDPDKLPPWALSIQTHKVLGIR